MESPSPVHARWYGAGADALAGLHLLFVAFVVWTEILILVGFFMGWEWIDSLPLRGIHLGLVSFVGVQDVFGRVCPLTIWENQCRERAGQSVSNKPFIGRVLHRLLMCHISPRTQRIARLAFAAVVIATFVLLPPPL